MMDIDFGLSILIAVIFASGFVLGWFGALVFRAARAWHEQQETAGTRR